MQRYKAKHKGTKAAPTKVGKTKGLPPAKGKKK